MTKKKRFKDSSQPFILDHTLGFLSRHGPKVLKFCRKKDPNDREGVPKERVTLFVANEEEAQEYLKAFEALFQPQQLHRTVPMHQIAIFVRALSGVMSEFKCRFLVCETAVSWQ